MQRSKPRSPGRTNSKLTVLASPLEPVLNTSQKTFFLDSPLLALVLFDCPPPTHTLFFKPYYSCLLWAHSKGGSQFDCHLLNRTFLVWSAKRLSVLPRLHMPLSWSVPQDLAINLPSIINVLSNLFFSVRSQACALGGGALKFPFPPSLRETQRAARG